jgi:predicted Zn-dependent peptidase
LKQTLRSERAEGPAIQEPGSIVLPAFSKEIMPNGMSLFMVRGGTQEVLKLELLFDGGKIRETKRAVAKSTAALIGESTRTKSNAQISEFLDYHAATLQTRSGVDVSRITLYCLTARLPQLLPVIADIALYPAFAEEELEDFKKQAIHRLRIELSRNESIADRILTEKLFSKDHPYGYNTTEEDIRMLNREDLISHHRNHYHLPSCRVFLSGSFTEKTVDSILSEIGSIKTDAAHTRDIRLGGVQEVGSFNFNGPQKFQAALRIGSRLFGREHPDFMGLFVLNALLGGYFSSRLMTNIREEKGLTYNIFSSVDSFVYDGCFYIGTELDESNVGITIKEIYQEFKKLREEQVSVNELRMLKNYLLGNLMTQLDGPFNPSEIIKTLILESGDTLYFSKLVQTIKNITPEKIQELACKYLLPEKMSEIIVHGSGAFPVKALI